jgi:hypothetical protein
MTNQTKNKFFILHKDSLSILNKLTDEQAGQLFKAIYKYQLNNTLPQDNFISIIIYPFLNQFSRDDIKYQITCEARKIAGSKGGKQKVANASNCLQKVANASNCLQKVANLADSKNESDSESKNKNDQEYIINSNNILIEKNIIAKKEKVKNFVKPTIEELTDYCNQNVLNVDPENFIDYYNSNGWKVGKNAMKDWQATARTWHRNNKNNNQVNYQKTNGMTAKQKANWQAFADFGNNNQTF